MRWTRPLVVALVTLAPLGLVRRARVEGLSMRPTLEPGDRVVALRALRVRPGDLALCRDPRQPTRRLVKRALAWGPDGLDVAGDNADHSTDSRDFGAVPLPLVIGRVVHVRRSGGAARFAGSHHRGCD
ncbi:MAG: nickel-type superoxide dismutase maturation protease [Acidimicrobiia bacterium]|nr:nickel-type superoxide dismutase maturation protease [Acidimicrobiia bacterium]